MTHKPDESGEYWIDDWARAYKSILELRENTKHGPIIHVISFDKHQQILAEAVSVIEEMKLAIERRMRSDDSLDNPFDEDFGDCLNKYDNWKKIGQASEAR